MNIFKNLGEMIANTAKNVGFTVKQHSPEILVGAGIISAGAAVVLACKQTMKMERVLDEHKEKIDKINELVEDDTTKYEDEDGSIKPYDEKTGKHDKRIAYRDLIFRTAKTYAVPAALFVLSMSCFVTSTVILKKRNAALVTAFNGLLASFQAYRQRVRDRVGEEEESDIYLNNHIMHLSDETTGDQWKDEKVDLNRPLPPFEFRFNKKTSPIMWDKDPEQTMHILTTVEDWVNAKVYDNPTGFSRLVTLPEVLTKLGLQLDKDEMKAMKQLCAGWVAPKFGGIVTHCDFGLDKYRNRNWPSDGDWILEFNCQAVQKVAGKANSENFAA